MKCLLLIITVLVIKTNAGVFQTLLYSDWITCDHNKTLDLDVSLVEVYFHDFKNNINFTYLIGGAVDGITSNINLDVTKKLIFFVPGYKSHISKKTEELVRQTFSNIDNSYLVIIDHSPYTSAKGGSIPSYERSVLYSYYIGRGMGKLLADFHRKGYPSRNMHCIGHSLGAQMLGFAGSEYISLTSEKLWRITGLDPAGPCFSNSFVSDQLRSGLAEYVEVYHCNAGGLGTTSVLADADFFINEGKWQPHCSGGIIPGKSESQAAKCSHKRCVSDWIKTVNQPESYLAWRCDSYKLFSEGKCAANEVTIAGYSNPGNATGTFYASSE